MTVNKDKNYLPPHWILAGFVKRCSVCGYPFPPKILAIEAAFKEHMLAAHKPGQTTEDASQSAARKV